MGAYDELAAEFVHEFEPLGLSEEEVMGKGRWKEEHMYFRELRSYVCEFRGFQLRGNSLGRFWS